MNRKTVEKIDSSQKFPKRTKNKKKEKKQRYTCSKKMGKVWNINIKSKKRDKKGQNKRKPNMGLRNLIYRMRRYQK